MCSSDLAVAGGLHLPVEEGELVQEGGAVAGGLHLPVEEGELVQEGGAVAGTPEQFGAVGPAGTGKAQEYRLNHELFLNDVRLLQGNPKAKNPAECEVYLPLITAPPLLKNFFVRYTSL